MRRVLILTVIVFLTGAILSGLLFVQLTRQREWSLNLALNAESERHLNTLLHQIDNNRIAIQALGRFYESSESVTPEEFLHFTQSLTGELPGIVSFHYVPRILQSERAAFEAEARAMGYDGYAIRDGLETSEARPVYYPVLHSSPAGSGFTGLDLYAPSLRQDCINRSLASTEPVLSDPFSLEEEPRYAMLLRVGDTEDMVMAVVQIRDLFAQALNPVDSGQIRIVAVDENAESDAPLYLLNQDSSDNGSGGQVTLQRTRSLVVGTHTLTLHFFPTASFYFAHDLIDPRIPSILALLLTLLLTRYVYLSQTRSIQLEKMVREKTHQLEAMAHHDTLTGLFNRRKFFDEAQMFINRYKRHREPFALAMLDLDYFKTVNDLYGHDVGDAVLTLFAGFMKSAARENDILVRYGGEEFIILFENADRFLARDVLMRILGELHSVTFDVSEESITVTFSAGIADVTETPSIDKLVRLADQRMYAAKQDGRDRIEIES